LVVAQAPNVIAMMKAYEEVSLWVATEILTQDKARRRVKLIKKFIDIAKVRAPHIKRRHVRPKRERVNQS
jgi:hypothetical protein